MRVYKYSAILIVAAAIYACGGDKNASESARKPTQEIKPTVVVPKPIPQYEGTPYWEIQSRRWPAHMEWTLDANSEYTYDSLYLRMTGNVLQSFLSGPKGKEHPLVCSFELTVRPIPKKLIGYSFNIDSVVFDDPIKKRRLPALPMLSSERYSESGTVRTRFSNNMALLYSPDLEENQPLVPNVFLTSVDKKTIRIAMAPMNVSFIKEIKTQTTPTDSLKWESGT